MVEIITEIQPEGWKGIVYGPPGIGKSTWATYAPNPVFIDIEKGLNRIKCHRTPVQTTYSMFQQTLQSLYSSQYQTIVIDTLDFLDTLICNHIVQREGWNSIADGGFGRGYDAARREWEQLMSFVDHYVNAGRNVLFVAHEEARRVTPPDSDAFDKYQIKVKEKTASQIKAKVDFVFFAHWETRTMKDSSGSGRLRGISTGRRLLETQESAAWDAKNRFSLSGSIDMDASAFQYLI